MLILNNIKIKDMNAQDLRIGNYRKYLRQSRPCKLIKFIKENRNNWNSAFCPQC